MIKEIIFDCFGVLTEDGWLAFVHQFETEENKEELRFLNHQIDKGLIPYEDFLEKITQLTTATKEQAHTIITTTHHPNLPVFEYASALKSEGYELGIISNVGSKLDNFLPADLLSIFDRVTLSYEAASIKPEPRIYEVHLAKSGYEPNEVVFIDDREVNCEGARSVGMRAICHKNLSETEHALQQLLR